MEHIENKTFNLKIVSEQLISKFPTINTIALFGSRRFRTKSIRSDIDLLITTSDFIKPADIRLFAEMICPALDIFVLDNGRAISCMNESFVQAGSNSDLTEMLQAIEFWNRDSGFHDVDIPWEHEISLSVNYVMTALPNRVLIDGSTQKFFELIESAGYSTRPFIGTSASEIALFLCSAIEKMIMKKADLGQRGQAKDGWTVNLQSEYDFQNLFWAVIKPWLPTLAREEIEIKYDGQAKYSDFNLFGSKIIIEMKYIDTVSKKAEVVKTLSGLSDFYTKHPNVEAAIFTIFVDKSIDIDSSKWESDFSYTERTPQVITKVFMNEN